MKRTNCVSTTETDIKELSKSQEQTLKRLGIPTGDLSKVEWDAAIIALATQKNMTVDALLTKDNIQAISQAVAGARNKKTLEQGAVEYEKIGNATVHIGEKFYKSSPTRNPTTLYVFTDNLQAYNAYADTPIRVTGLVFPKDGPVTHVMTTSAMLRTNTNRDRNNNTIGFVVKKNAQNQDGSWAKNGEGVFEDTDEDFQAFVNINTEIVRQIKQRLLATNSPYTKLSMVDRIALDNAGLPKRFAEALQNILFNELGFTTQVLISKFGKNLYGLEVSSFEKTQREDAKNEREKKKEAEKKKDLEDATASSKVERPALSSDTVSIDKNNVNILARVFPNIEERIARISYISTVFSEEVDFMLQQEKREYAKRMQQNPTFEDGQIYEALTSGTEAQQRKALLELVPKELKGRKVSMADYIIYNMRAVMSQVIHLVELVDRGEQDASYVANGIFTSQSYIAREFNIEAGQNGWRGVVLDQMKVRRMRYLSEQFKIMLNPDIFNALFKEAALSIEFNENLRLLTNGEDIIISKDLDTIDREDDESEGSADNRTGLNLTKYKLLDPAKTLSIRMKTLLSKLYKTRDGGYIFNDLGQRVRMNSSVAYYILLHHFSSMNRSADFEGALQEAARKYSWTRELIDKLNTDQDLKNEFYCAFRKVFVPYGYINTKGVITKMNQTANRESFKQEIDRLYFGCMPLSEFSIYDHEGQCNPENVLRVHSWVVMNKNTKMQDRMKRHPLAWAKAVLDKPNGKDYTSKNILKAMEILGGEIEGVPGIEDLLHALGVPTDTLDLESLVPNFTYELRSKINSDNPTEKAEAFDEINSIVTPQVRNNLTSIIQAAITITSTSGKSNNRGYSPGDILVEDFKGAYYRIADALQISSEAFSQASFNGIDNKPKFSYTVPDFISVITGIMNNAKTDEEARQYLEENYGKIDFFRDQKTGEWYNTWIRDLYENPSLRAAFTYINILGVGGKTSNSSIQKVTPEHFKDGIITAFFTAGTASDGTLLGRYRNPLFSDADALVLVTQRRYAGPNYKDEILDGLVLVMRQEIDRILSVGSARGDAPIIEFYNDKRGNALKFNFLPQFNDRLKEILIDFVRLGNSENVEDARKAQDSYLKNLLWEDIEGIQLPDGTVVGGRLNAFLDEISMERRDEILTSISDSETKVEDEDSDDNDEIIQVITPKDTESTEDEITEQRKIEAEAKLTEFFYNDYFAHTQFIQLIGGDLAQYKNFADFVKRCKENYACGERMYALDANGNPIMQRVMELEDSEVVSNTWTQIRDLLDSEQSGLSTWERDILRGAVASFTKICETDGQSFRTLDSFKKILKAYGGRWTDEAERAYNNIKAGKVTIEDFKSIWNVAKQFTKSHVVLDIPQKDGSIRKEKVGVQYKNSEYMLTALFGTLNTILNKSHQLRGLQKFMEDHQIDVVHFHSVVKHGSHDRFDINYDYNKFYAKHPDVKFSDFLEDLKERLLKGKITQEEYNKTLGEFAFTSDEAVYNQLESQLRKRAVDTDKNSPTYGQRVGELEEDPNMIDTVPLEDYMMVQPTDDHLIDHDALFGSQLRNITPADLPEDFSAVMTINGIDIKVTKETFCQLYNTLITDQIVDSYDTLQKKFTDNVTLANYLAEMTRNNPKYGDDVKAALTLDPKTRQFKVSFNFPSLKNKINELILSPFKNNIQRQRINGGNVVLVSNFGLSDKLHVAYNSDGSINHIPAYMPAYMRTIVQDYLIAQNDGSWIIDFKKLKENNSEDILKIIGYRIPTEDKYSMLPIKIVGFLPVAAGTTIILPSDIITMSGTDFDIDKLFLMIKATRRITYENNLASEFREWLDPEVRKSLRDNDPEESRIIERIIHKTDGFTEEEIDYYIDNSPMFEYFMDKKGYDLALEFPKYVVKTSELSKDEAGNLDINATSKLEGYSKNERHDIRNNMLIDLIWGVLTTREGSKSMCLPGSYPNVKQGSRQQWIWHNREACKKAVEAAGGYDKLFDWLMRTKTEDLEKFYEDYASTECPMTIDYYVQKHQNLMDGNALIGVYAVNSSTHYKLQFLSPGTKDQEGKYLTSENVLLSDAYKFLFTFRRGTPSTLIELVSPRISPLTGVPVGRICAEFQAASPDNGKDPCLGDLGASTTTAYFMNYLMHLGLPPQVIGFLNTSDLITEYASTIKDIDSEKLDPFDGDITRVVELGAKIVVEGGLMDPKDRVEAKKFANWVGTIDDAAKVFNLLSSISRVDSPNGALPVKSAEVIQQLLRMEDFFTIAKSPDCPITGLDRLINPELSARRFANLDALREEILKTPIPRLQAAYSLGIVSARDLASAHLVELKSSFLDAVRLLRDQTKKTLTSTKDAIILTKLINDLSTFLLSYQGSLFSGTADGKDIMELRNYYINDFPIKFKKFLEEKDEKGHFKHREVMDLPIIRRMSNNNREGIKLKNVGKLAAPSRKYYTEAMESLLYSDDPETVKFGIDLLMYSFFDSGLNYGPNNYGMFFTTAFITALPGIIDVLNRANGRLESDPTMAANYIYQFLFNHKEFGYAFRQFFKKSKDSDKDEIKIPKKQAEFLRSGSRGTGNYINFIVSNGSLYQRVIGDDNGKASSVVVYKKVASNDTNKKKFRRGVSNYTAFYDATKTATEIDWKKLKDRGAVVELEEEKKEEPKDNKEKDIKAPKDLEKDLGNAPKETEFVAPVEDNDGKERGISAVAGALESDGGLTEEDTELVKTLLASALGTIEKSSKELRAPEEKKEPSLMSFEETKDPTMNICKTKK